MPYGIAIKRPLGEHALGTSCPLALWGNVQTVTENWRSL